MLIAVYIEVMKFLQARHTQATAAIGGTKVQVSSFGDYQAGVADESSALLLSHLHATSRNLDDHASC